MFYLKGRENAASMDSAWAYVALRASHTGVHLTYSHVDQFARRAARLGRECDGKGEIVPISGSNALCDRLSPGAGPYRGAGGSASHKTARRQCPMSETRCSLAHTKSRR